MVDNFNIAKSIIIDNARTTHEDNLLYVVHIRKRNKDFNEGNEEVLSLPIHSWEELKEKREVIRVVCEAYKARAYFTINPARPKDVSRFMQESLIALTFSNAESGYTSLWKKGIMKNPWANTKKTLLDVDDLNVKLPDDVPYLYEAPTVNGRHYIVTKEIPWRFEKELNQLTDVEVKKNDSILLYFNS